MTATHLGYLLQNQSHVLIKLLIYSLIVFECMRLVLGVAVVFDDDEEKAEESEVDEVFSEDEEDEDQELGMEARKGRSLR